LQARINKFNDKATSFLPGCILDQDEDGTDDYTSDLDDPGSDSDDEDSEANPFQPSTGSDLEPEKAKVLLPSLIGEMQCRENGLADVLAKELKLREAQANDALKGLRLSIGKKSFLFRTKLRTSKSKVKKLRSWDSIHLVDKSVQHYAELYRRARLAMVRLGATSEMMGQFKVLKKEHLRCSTLIVDPNQRGQRNNSLAWFWGKNVRGQVEKDGLMLECEPGFISSDRLQADLTWSLVYRVHWLRSSSRRDRWQEEWNLANHEMDWLVRYFEHQADLWRGRSERSAGDAKLGHRCYGLQKSAMWTRFASDAKSAFEKLSINGS
jgi:hypothetical protein